MISKSALLVLLLGACRICDGPSGYHTALWVRQGKDRPKAVAACISNLLSCEQLAAQWRNEMPNYEVWCEVVP